MKEDINKELVRWYRKNYIQPNCYSIMDDPKIMRASGYYFILERPRNRQPMDPIRIMNKVRIWDGTPTKRFLGKKKSSNFFRKKVYTVLLNRDH